MHRIRNIIENTKQALYKKCLINQLGRARIERATNRLKEPAPENAQRSDDALIVSHETFPIPIQKAVIEAAFKALDPDLPQPREPGVYD